MRRGIWQVQIISVLGTNLIKKQNKNHKLITFLALNKIVPWLRCFYFNKYSGFKKKPRKRRNM